MEHDLPGELTQPMKVHKEGEQKITYRADYNSRNAPVIDSIYLNRWAALLVGDGEIPKEIYINIRGN